MIKKINPCWCSSEKLIEFSPDYYKCTSCETLVLKNFPNFKSNNIDDDKDFYGKEYYDRHLIENYDYPSLKIRSREDLTERCLYWLRTILKYKFPPADVIELGSAHGGFVALLSKFGYTATGLELSPAIVEFSKKTFDIPVLCGPIESQSVGSASLDVIALMDVIEHLPDPVATMTHCINLLRKNGILLIQCPSYPEGMTYKEMVGTNSPFLHQLKTDEHLYLFSKSSIRQFFNQLGAAELRFEPAIFDQYDMFCVVGRQPLTPISKEDVCQSLLGSPKGRILQAILDLGDQRDSLETHLSEVNKDRTERLALVKKLETQLAEVEDDRSKRLSMLENLSHQLEEVEKDRRARLELIEKLGNQLTLVEEDRAERLRIIETLSKQLSEKE